MILVPGGSKECSDCHEIKPLEAFHRNKKGPLGRAYKCKERVHRRYEFRRNGIGPDPRSRRVVPAGHKWCPGCECMLPKNEFGQNSSANDGLTAYCRPCHNRIGRENRIRLVGSTRNFHLKRRYGLTEDDVKELLKQQGGVCAICGTEKPEHVDHCHVTGKVRGVLCFNCNGGLGQFKDDIGRLVSAIAYLEEKSWIEPVEPVGYRLST